MSRPIVAGIVGITLCAAAPALAQTAPPAQAPAGAAFGGDNPNRQPVEGPTAKTGSKGLLAPVGRSLADRGIYIRSLLTNEVAGNVNGGARQGTTNVGQVYVGGDLDLHRIVGWKGAKFHFTLYRDYGHGLNKEVTGTFFKQQEIYKNDYTQFHVGLVSLEQQLLHDKVDIIVGRLGTTSFYGHLQTNCYFQQGTFCGVPRILNGEGGYSLLPSATWGGNLRYNFSKKLYVEAGAFEVNPYIAQTNGLVFSTSRATGVTVPVEIGYENADFKKVKYPSEVKIGGYASTGTRVDPFYNVAGQSAGLTGTKQRDADGLRSGAYIIADRAIWRPDMHTSQSLTLFGGYAQPFEREEVFDVEVFGGLLLRQPFKTRPLDTIGFSASYFHISGKEVGYLRDTRIRLGGGGTNNPHEFAFELNYGIGVNRSIRLTPNIQYVVHPDNSQLPKITFVPKNMVTFGLKLAVNLAQLFGFPSQASAR